MLYARDIPLYLWAEAVNCATYILNRTSNSQTQNQTPFEIWNRVKPQLSHVRIFGSEGYVHIPDQLRTKLDKKSEKMILVGYDNTNYRMYNIRTKQIKITRNVIFNENKIPEIRRNITKIQLEQEMDSNDEDFNEVLEEDDTLLEISSSDNSMLSANSDISVNEPSQEIEEIERDRIVIIYIIVNIVEFNLPATYGEAIRSSQKNEWSNAVKEELLAHKENNTWTSVKRSNQRTLKTK